MVNCRAAGPGFAPGAEGGRPARFVRAAPSGPTPGPGGRNGWGPGNKKDPLGTEGRVLAVMVARLVLLAVLLCVPESIDTRTAENNRCYDVEKRAVHYFALQSL